MPVKLTRRTVLRGVGGAMVGLPVLECMLNAHGTGFVNTGKAFAQAAGALPQRYAVVFAGQALGGDDYGHNEFRVNGESMMQDGHYIVPPESGTGYTLTTPLRPLAMLQDDFTLVSGMRIPYNKDSDAPEDVPAAGAYRDFHGGGCSPLICGTRSLAPDFTARSATSDQLIAELNRGKTTLDSLVLRAQPSFYLSGYSFSGRHRMSFRGDGDAIEAHASAQIAYQSVFGNFMPDDVAGRAVHEFDQRARKSVLDLILNKRARVLGMVGAADRIRLERHFDEIRDLETRIGKLGPEATGQCKLPADPGADPPIGGDNAGAGSDAIATNTGYSNEHEVSRVMADLIHMAFVCDLTRAATLQITAFQSHMNVFPLAEYLDSPIALSRPIRADLHEVGHNGDVDFRGQLPVSLMLQWHISHYAYLIDKLKRTPEGAGTLLDNAAIVFMPEAGHGGHLNTPTDTTPKTHSVEDMVLLVAGRAGGLKPGRHLATSGAHPGQCLLSCMKAVGHEGDKFGEVEDDMPELFA